MEGLRPLTLGEILDASIRIYRGRARTLLLAVAVPVVPVLIFGDEGPTRVGVVDPAPDQLESAIYAETKEYLESRFTAGEYDLLDDADPVLKAANNNPYLISWLRFEPGQTHVKRVVLPEAEFAEFYRLRELSTWLSRTSRDRDREASDKD